MAHLRDFPSETAQSCWFELIPHLKALSDTQLEIIGAEAKKVFSLSDFVMNYCRRNPDKLFESIQNNRFEAPVSKEQMCSLLEHKVQDTFTEIEYKRIIREFRNEQMVAIYWRDLTEKASVKETCEQVSLLADTCIEITNDYLHKLLLNQLNIKQSNDEVAPLLVIGMGKLGGCELNVSSDIDLIFCYQNHSGKNQAEKSINLEKFYTRLGQRLIQILDERTAQGFVFRVDMRLRPYGDSGPIVMSFSAMEEYYQEQGRDWERFALVKARIITGDKTNKDKLYDLFRPFVFRRYIDFSVLESPRKMKNLINQELRRKNLTNNIKLGPGGIREVEFITQALQLIHGGKEKQLQCRSLFEALPLLGRLGHLPKSTVNSLLESYLFLRKVEHRLQAKKDYQTQSLPEGGAEQKLLALGLDFTSWNSLVLKISETMKTIHDEFINQFQDDQEKTSTRKTAMIYKDIWHFQSSTKESHDLILGQANFKDTEAISQLLDNFKSSSAIKNMGPRGANRLDQLMPAILEIISSMQAQELALQRVLRLLNSILKRTAYLELLAENKGALNQMIILCSASARIADQIADYPYVLDELINPQTLLHPPSISEFPDTLRQMLGRIPEDDPEQQMDCLREFRQINLLRITAADISNAMTVQQVSRHLTTLAETIIEAVIKLAWHQLLKRHGYPSCYEEQSTAVNSYEVIRGFAVIAYGKLGGHELGYGSDLDLVFLHSADKGMTSGERPIENATFYMRLAQKIIHFLNIRTRSGVLYEVDMRLRPSGNSGLLVSHIDAFNEYQKEEAWTWEHQALIRSRCIFGDNYLSEKFELIRQAVICSSRDNKKLGVDVYEMREKMRLNLLPEKMDQDTEFDIKQSPGGITDVEFLTQYLVLKHAEKQPNLAISSNTTELLSFLATKAMSGDKRFNSLIVVYEELRRLQNSLAIQNLGNVVKLQEVESLALDDVITLWSEYILNPSEGDSVN